MIIPAILAKTRKEFKEKLDLISPYADIIQIDVMDGVFVPNTTWADAKEIKKMRLPMRFEMHLMVQNPEEGILEEWAKAGAFRIIFHIEATKKAGECVKQIKKFHCEAGIAINPNTPVEKIKSFLPSLCHPASSFLHRPAPSSLRHPAFSPSCHPREGGDLPVDYVLVMGVHPGFSGQKFQPVALQKIKQIRALAPNIEIGVDGGVDKITAKKLYAAGATNLTAASAIFKSKNIAKAMESLEK